MKLKNIHKTAGQQVQDWAVENQIDQGNIENLEVEVWFPVNKYNFDWGVTSQGYFFWCDVDDGMSEQQLKEKYPNLPWKPQTPKEIAQNLLEGLSDEVLEEVRKLVGNNGVLDDVSQRFLAEKIILALDDYGRKVNSVEYGLPIDPETKDFEYNRPQEMLKIVTDILNCC